MSSPERTDTNGQAFVTVKRSTTTVTERVKLYKLYIESGGVRFHYDVSNACDSEGDVGSNKTFTPTAQGRTIDNIGQCMDLANIPKNCGKWCYSTIYLGKLLYLIFLVCPLDLRFKCGSAKKG